MKKIVAVAIMLGVMLIAASTGAYAQVMSSATPTSVVVGTSVDREAKLKQLIASTFVLNPWPAGQRQPDSFGLPDSKDRIHSFDRDYKGKVTLLYLYSQG